MNLQNDKTSTFNRIWVDFIPNTLLKVPFLRHYLKIEIFKLILYEDPWFMYTKPTYLLKNIDIVYLMPNLYF